MIDERVDSEISHQDQKQIELNSIKTIVITRWWSELLGQNNLWAMKLKFTWIVHVKMEAMPSVEDFVAHDWIPDK
jgi:hypothetical protein